MPKHMVGPLAPSSLLNSYVDMYVTCTLDVALGCLCSDKSKRSFFFQIVEFKVFFWGEGRHL